jgi:hypothetical protein
MINTMAFSMLLQEVRSQQYIKHARSQTCTSCRPATALLYHPSLYFLLELGLEKSDQSRWNKATEVGDKALKAASQYATSRHMLSSLEAPGAVTQQLKKQEDVFDAFSDDGITDRGMAAVTAGSITGALVDLLLDGGKELQSADLAAALADNCDMAQHPVSGMVATGRFTSRCAWLVCMPRRLTRLINSLRQHKH